MEDNDNNQEIERWLDAGLRHYADVEHRAGLEARILATLQAEQGRDGYHLRRWQLGLALAMVGVAGAALFLRPEGVHQGITPAASNIQVTAEPEISQPVKVAGAVRRTRLGRRTSTSSLEERARDPRLEQFPSPQPLTEQEEMLARYVRDQRREALMVARARAALENKEFLPTAQQLPSVEPLPDSQQ